MCHDERKSQKKVVNIVVYQDDLYIVSPTPETILNTLQNKYKLNINQGFFI